MGYGSRNNGQIKTYWPDDGEDRFYIAYDASLLEILNRASEKWGEINLDKIRIEAEHIQTDCLSYDRYDSGDYTNFLIIYKVN
jgi:hypothetical protein